MRKAIPPRFNGSTQNRGPDNSPRSERKERSGIRKEGPRPRPLGLIIARSPAPVAAEDFGWFAELSSALVQALAGVAHKPEPAAHRQEPVGRKPALYTPAGDLRKRARGKGGNGRELQSQFPLATTPAPMQVAKPEGRERPMVLLV